MKDESRDLVLIYKIFKNIDTSPVGIDGLTDREFEESHRSIKNTPQNREAIFKAKKILTK